MVQDRNELWKAGNGYLRAGLSVLAVQGKVPHVRHCPHGFKSPLVDYAALERAVLDPSVTGLGLVCSPHLWVLDIDKPEGWTALTEAGVFPLSVPTAVAITARGAHFWFRSDKAVETRPQGGRFLPGVDLKASGYVVAPPSEHPSGVNYRWYGASLALGAFPYAADAPRSLLDVVFDFQFREDVLGPSPMIALTSRDLTPLASHLRRSDPGERNGTLNWCALRAGASGSSLSEALAALLPVALEVGLTERESRATIRSGWQAGSKEVVSP